MPSAPVQYAGPSIYFGTYVVQVIVKGLGRVYALAHGLYMRPDRPCGFVRLPKPRTPLGATCATRTRACVVRATGAGFPNPAPNPLHSQRRPGVGNYHTGQSENVRMYQALMNVSKRTK